MARTETAPCSVCKGIIKTASRRRLQPHTVAVDGVIRPCNGVPLRGPTPSICKKCGRRLEDGHSYDCENHPDNVEDIDGRGGLYEF